MTASAQDKQREIAFFDAHAGGDAYDVFTPQASARLVDAFVAITGLAAGARVADLGCGSGAFTHLLEGAGYACVGVDLSAKLLAIGRRKYPQLQFIAGDIEQLPFADASLDGILLSGVVHHFPDPSRCAAEVFRVLRPGGRFVAFDPNRISSFQSTTKAVISAQRWARSCGPSTRRRGSSSVTIMRTTIPCRQFARTHRVLFPSSSCATRGVAPMPL